MKTGFLQTPPITPSFPGGESAWNRYIKKIFEQHTNELIADNKSGTCVIRLIVAKDGTISDVHAITMQSSKLAEVAVNAIRQGPKFIPGRQNGEAVNAYVEVPVTFMMDESKSDNALIVVDDVVRGRDVKDLNTIPSNSIESITVLKGQEALKKYGDKGLEGVIEVNTKQNGNKGKIPYQIKGL